MSVLSTKLEVLGRRDILLGTEFSEQMHLGSIAVIK